MQSINFEITAGQDSSSIMVTVKVRGTRGDVDGDLYTVPVGRMDDAGDVAQMVAQVVNILVRKWLLQ